MAMIKRKNGVFFSFTAILILLALFVMFAGSLSIQTSPFLEDSEHEQISVANSNILFLKDTYMENMLGSSFRHAVSAYLEASDSARALLIDCMSDGVCDDDSDEIDSLKELLKVHMATGQLVEKDDVDADEISFDLSETRNMMAHLNSIMSIFRDDFLIDIVFLDSDGDEWPMDDEGMLDIDTGLILTEVIDHIEITQELPFSVQISYRLSLRANVRGGSASWQHDNIEIDVPVSLSGLVDPLYMVGTIDTFGEDLQFNNTIREDSRASRDNLQSVVALYDEMRYVAAPSLGPSYLQRLVNSPNPSSCCGIESLVNLNRMFGTGINISIMPDNWFRRSNVDHKYFFHDRPSGNNIYSCEELTGTADEQLYAFPELALDDGKMFFNLDSFYTSNYNFDELLGSQLCEFSTECQLDESCAPSEE